MAVIAVKVVEPPVQIVGAEGEIVTGAAVLLVVTAAVEVRMPQGVDTRTPYVVVTLALVPPITGVKKVELFPRGTLGAAVSYHS
ncbi:hypothetical protein GCM10027511_24710 [Hymenobacter humi]